MAIVINGSGTVTGLAVGGLPDGTVDSDTLASGIDKTSISDSGDATAITIDSSEKVALGGSGSVSSDSQVAIKTGNLELTTAGSKYWIARASDGALTGSLYSPSGSAVRLSGAGTGSGTIEFEPSSSSGVAMTINNSGKTKIVTGSGELGLEVYRPTTSTGGDIFRIYSDVGGTETAVGIIEANGDFLSATNSYGSTSDERIKEQITDANNQWQDVSAIRLRNFKFKNDVAENGDDALLHLGVIAQELEEAGMSGLVSENEDGVKCVKTSVMLLKALGALQEAMSRIEELTTRIETLENA
jgi:hypothetical protein